MSRQQKNSSSSNKQGNGYPPSPVKMGIIRAEEGVQCFHTVQPESIQSENPNIRESASPSLKNHEKPCSLLSMPGKHQLQSKETCATWWQRQWMNKDTCYAFCPTCQLPTPSSNQFHIESHHSCLTTPQPSWPASPRVLQLEYIAGAGRHQQGRNPHLSGN